jgi:DNA polymerase elongation subunit (family B)
MAATESTLNLDRIRPFVRSEWSLADKENQGNNGKYLYLKNVKVMDGPIPETKLPAWQDVARGNASSKHVQWWKDHEDVLNQKLFGDMSMFSFSGDAFHDDVPEDEEDTEEKSTMTFRKRYRRDTPFTEVVLLGLTPAGSTVTWRVLDFRPYFFIRVQPSITDKEIEDLRIQLTLETKSTVVEILPFLAPQFLEFDPDEKDPSKAKNQSWLRVSFDTTRQRKVAIQFLQDRRPELYLAEFNVDNEQMFLKTYQYDIDAWYYLDTDFGVKDARERISTSAYERLVPDHAKIFKIKDSWSPYTKIDDDTNEQIGLVYDRKYNFIKTILRKDLPSPTPPALTSSDFIPPHVVGAFDIEVSGELNHPDLFPDPMNPKHAAYTVCVSFAFAGSVPMAFKEKVPETGKPFFELALICKPCLESSDYFLEVVHSETYMYDRFRDWMYGLMDVDIGLHFNGFMFDQPYIWSRITGQKSNVFDKYKDLGLRYVWTSRIWSLPAQPYFKEVKQKKRNKNTPSALAKKTAGEAEAAAEEEEEEDDDEEEDENDLLALKKDERYQLIWKSPGRADIDLLRYVREFYRNEVEYKLDHLAKKYLKDQKDDIHHYDITLAYYSAEDKDRLRVVDYCVQDCALTVRLFQKFLCFEQLRAIGQVTITPISTLITVGQQKRLLNMFIHFAADFGYVMNGIKDNRYAVKTSYSGGLVQEPVVGLHYGLAAVDFASLYPSIMRAYGLCYTTFVSDEKYAEIQAKFSEDQIRNVMKIDTHEPRPGVKYRFAQCFMSVLCKVLEILVNRRKMARAVEEDAHEKGNKEVELVYNKLQLAIKVVCNSVYGFTGVGIDKGPIMGNQAISETTTFMGQTMISACRRWLEDGDFIKHLKEKPDLLVGKKLSPEITREMECRVIYGDTDSLFFTVGETIVLDDIFRLGTLAAEYITGRFQDMVKTTKWTNPIKLELEKVFGSFLSIRKKCYAGICIEKIDDCIKFSKGEKAGKLLPRGLKAVRRDTFGLLKNVSFQIMNTMLLYRPIPEGANKGEYLERMKRENVDATIKIIRQGVQKMLTNDTTLDDFVVTGELQLSYDSNMACPPHAAVGWRRKYLPGERVPFVLVQRPDTTRMYSPENGYVPKEIKKKSGRWNGKDFLKPPDLKYPVAAYARHPEEVESVKELNKLHYMKLFKNAVTRFFVAGIPGSEDVFSIFRDAFEKIYYEETGNKEMEIEHRVVEKRGVPMSFFSPKR